MAFKPLGMETVLESVDENLNSKHDWKKKLKTGVTRHGTGKLAPQTTEQNIEFQQRLDFASAEDFISFPRFSTLDLAVKEEKVPINDTVSP